MAHVVGDGLGAIALSPVDATAIGDLDCRNQSGNSPKHTVAIMPGAGKGKSVAEAETEFCLDMRIDEIGSAETGRAGEAKTLEKPPIDRMLNAAPALRDRTGRPDFPTDLPPTHSRGRLCLDVVSFGKTSRSCSWSDVDHLTF
jgi:hypothetical protein